MKCLEVILALGGLAHGAVISTLGHRKSAWKFGHNVRHELPGGPVLFQQLSLFAIQYEHGPPDYSHVRGCIPRYRSPLLTVIQRRSMAKIP